MSSSVKLLDPAFHGAGQKPGTEIWRIENLQPVPLPKSDYGKFYMGDSYIVLQTTAGKGGSNLYDIHFWIGKDTSQDEAGTAAIKAIELDAVLGGRAVQHRELQGHESDQFLSYFKPCLIPLEGGIASGIKEPEEGELETRLYVCRGKRVVKLKQVRFDRSSLNHDDVFILDTQNKIYQFNGANSDIQERAKALEVTRFLKEKYHDEKCDVSIVGEDPCIHNINNVVSSAFLLLTSMCINIITLPDDGKLGSESNSDEFWVFFGGFAPLGKKVTSEDDNIPGTAPAKLYSITDGELKPVEGKLLKDLLENKKCYLLDCGAEVFVWVGRATHIDDRKTASQVVEDFVTRENRVQTARITRVIQGYESNSFKSNFDSWPVGSKPPSVEEGRGKVAAFLKKQGVGAKGMSKITPVPVNVEVPPLLEGSGKMEVWCINDSLKTPLPNDDIGKFYSGDCYIVLYNYHSDERKEDYFLCCWIGNDSIEEDQQTAYKYATTFCNSLKGRPVQGRVFEGKEPPQFIALFQPMVVLKGGQSSGYKKSLADKGLTDETYTADSSALFRISGTDVHNNKVLQVNALTTLLNSTECFLLQSEQTIFLWQGNESTNEQKQLAAKIAAFFKPGVSVKNAREGKESNSFWLALGGKRSYTCEKASFGSARDPHLFTFTFKKGLYRAYSMCKFTFFLQVEEIYNFSQDDLLTEDILILDTHAEVFVWVGQRVDVLEKQSVFEIGQKYIDRAACLDGLSPIVPLYKVTEGNEPCFFTAFFSWDPHRATVQGNSYQKKMALLFGASLTLLLGASHAAEDTSMGLQGGKTQRAAALAALSSAFNPSPAKSTPSDRCHEGPTQRSAALAALMTALNPSAEPKTSSPKPPSSSQGSQRASALAALEFAFNPSSETKTSAPKHISFRQASQRAAAIAALSSVLTAECKKQPPALSPKKHSRSTSPITSPPPVAKSPADPCEGKDSAEVAKTNDDHSEPKEQIDQDQDEAYLSDKEFYTVFGTEKKHYTNRQSGSEMPRRSESIYSTTMAAFITT
ncbi:Villin-2 [Hibiscus syriacus]|uniref:Villin-2 n=1 Tax=Hibiscus syriacus TaxID=106335 RepID=A0A6A2XZ27_HIBSY|nr:Villin-2 [Hibiscus syriacus]